MYVQNVPNEDKVNIIDNGKYDVSLGFTLEFCAGIIDKNKSVEQIAKEEILEETGYDVPIEKLQKIKTLKSNVATAVTDVHLFYVEVEDYMRIGEGGGVEEEGEFIQVIEMSVAEAKKICDDPSPSQAHSYYGFMYGLLWFFHYKGSTFNTS